LKRCISKQTAKRKIVSGLNARIMTKPAIRKLNRLFENNHKISKTLATRKFGCSHQYISQTLKNKTKIDLRKKKAPKYKSDVDFFCIRKLLEVILEHFCTVILKIKSALKITFLRKLSSYRIKSNKQVVYQIS